MTADGEARRRPKDRRARILDAAAALFAERGFAAVSMQDIGERTGITAAAIYRHFAGKDALLHELVLESLAAFEAVQGTRTGSRSDGVASLRVSLAQAVDAVAERPGRVRVFLRERHRVTRGATAEMRRRERAVDRFWADVIRGAVPGLGTDDVALRQHARLGVIGSLSHPGTSILGQRGRQVVVEGLEAALTVPPNPPGAAGAVVRQWDAPLPRRQQILRVAVQLFDERGFHGVALNDVGEAVGIAAASIYEHFDGKSDILRYAFDVAGSFLVAGALRAIRAAADADTALTLLIGSYVDVCATEGPLIRVTRREVGSVAPEDVRPLARRREDLYELWTGVLREVRPQLAHADARLLLRGMFALVASAARTPARGVTATTAAMARAFVLPGADTARVGA